MTDDFEWDMVGEQTVKGKEQVRQMFAKMDGSEMISCTKDLKLLDGNKGACHGIVKMKNANGDVSEMYYCDLYVFEDGLLQKMVTFSVKQGVAGFRFRPLCLVCVFCVWNADNTALCSRIFIFWGG